VHAASPVGFQRWRSLLFLHWVVPLERLRALVPEPLAIDTFAGRAYVGLIPFAMSDVRPRRPLPPVPTARAFLETNLRTYVTHGGQPGIWFFSLEAASSLAVLGARLSFGLPYFRARMTMAREEALVRYRSVRRWPRPKPAGLDVAYTVRDPLGAAQPGTLEHFLVERYTLFARRRGRLLRGQVRHTPYPLRRAEVITLDETLLAAAGLPSDGERAPDLYSDGVDVGICAPELLRST
jgi:uncharacterized protein YqjF (DUF2071 family)